MRSPRSISTDSILQTALLRFLRQRGRCAAESSFGNVNSRVLSPYITSFIRALILMFVVFNQLRAEDSHVSLWVSGKGSEKPTSAAVLKLKPNETAYLTSWPQDEFRSSFVTIWSGKHSATIHRKPEFEIDKKSKEVTKNGVLSLPKIVVAGPATLELSTVGTATHFCTFRVVKGESRIVESTEKTTFPTHESDPSKEPSLEVK